MRGDEMKMPIRSPVTREPFDFKESLLDRKLMPVETTEQKKEQARQLENLVRKPSQLNKEIREFLEVRNSAKKDVNHKKMKITIFLILEGLYHELKDKQNEDKYFRKAVEMECRMLSRTVTNPTFFDKMTMRNLAASILQQYYVRRKPCSQWRNFEERLTDYAYQLKSDPQSEKLDKFAKCFPELRYDQLFEIKVEEIEEGIILFGVDYAFIKQAYKGLKAASTKVPILILGESGTGKGLLAHLIHNESNRKDKPFMTVDCALPETLLESELFGHVKGGFTGAIKDKKGLLEVANGGTIFLDEIGDFSLTTQAKLLRFLDNHTFRQVGGTKEIEDKVDVRVIVATNRDLQDLIKEGKFREDLYYRISTIKVKLPPLREREDIPAIAHPLMFKIDPKKTISKSAMKKLMNYDWPGNVRELDNVLKRANINSIDRTIRESDIQFDEEASDEKASEKPDLNYKELSKEKKKGLVKRTHQECKGNKAEVARKLGIDRKTVYNYLKET